MISILVPSRCRPENLQRLVNSVLSCLSPSGHVEFVVRLDNNDPFLSGTDQRFGYDQVNYGDKADYVPIIENPGDGMGFMLDQCFRSSYGNIVLLCGDDLVMETKNFDTIVESLSAPDGIFLIYGDDGIQGKRLATHPFIGRSALEIIHGFHYMRDYKNDYIDTHLMDVFGRLAQKGCPRIAYNQELKTPHLHPCAGKAEMDDVYANKMSQESSLAVYQYLTLTREYQADMLKRAIG